MIDGATARRSFLMTPGPVTVAPEVAAAAAEPVLFHRGIDFQELFARLRDKLWTVFGGKEAFEVFILSGSGSLALESCAFSLFVPGELVLVLVNGEFGERLVRTLELHGVECRAHRVEWGEPFVMERVTAELRQEGISAVAMVAMETSTGMANPVREVGEECQRAGRLFLVDAVSALGAQELSAERDHIDVCVTVANKGLESLPGLGILFVRRTVLDDRRSTLGSKYGYLSVYRYQEFAARDQTPATPAVPLFRALDVALDRLLREGLAARSLRYRRLSQRILEHTQRLGIRCLIAAPGHRSNAVQALCHPAGVDVPLVQERLREQGIILWRPAGSTPLADRNILQVAVMGDIGDPEAERFLHFYSQYLGEQGGGVAG